MSSKRGLVSVILVLLLLLNYEVVRAQQLLFLDLSLDGLEKHFFYKSWSVRDPTGGETKISQFTLPVIVRFYWGGRANLSVRINPASSSLSIEGAKAHRFRFADLSDVKIEGSCVLWDQAALFTMGVNVPSGDACLNSNQLIVAKAIAEDALDLPLSLYGVGPEFNAGFFVAKEIGRFTVGGGISWFFRGKFRFLEEDDDSNLDPGDEYTASVGLDRDFQYWNVSLDTYFTHRQSDKLSGVTVFDPGEKLVLDISTNITYPAGLPVALQLLFKNRWKFGGELFAPPPHLEGILRSDLNQNPYQLELNGIINYQFGLHGSLFFPMEFKYLARNDAGSENAKVRGGGIGLRFNGLRAGRVEWFTLETSFKYYSGHLYSLGHRFELGGYQISTMMSCSF